MKLLVGYVMLVVLCQLISTTSSISSCQVDGAGDTVLIEASLVASSSYVFPRAGQLCVHLEWTTKNIWVDKVNITSCGDIGVPFNCTTTIGASDPCTSSTCVIQLCNYPELCKFTIATLEESVLLSGHFFFSGKQTALSGQLGYVTRTVGQSLGWSNSYPTVSTGVTNGSVSNPHNCEVTADCGHGECCGDPLWQCVCFNNHQTAPGWSGLHCDTDINECLSSPCIGDANGVTCNNTFGDFTCGCKTGYRGTGDRYNPCISIDRCHEDPAPCGHATICTMTGAGTYTCTCQSGFALVNGTCTDINECLASTTCTSNDANSHCVNLEGSYYCPCNDEYGGTPCIYHPPCAATPCHPLAWCTNTHPGFSCACRSGYYGDGVSNCTDIDECADHELSHDCNPVGVASCINLEGSYQCACPPGFTGTGKCPDHCKDIDECASGDYYCPTNTYCNNQPGFYTCLCSPGYQTVGGVCVEINECTQLTQSGQVMHNCSTASGAICTDHLKYATCACANGTTGTGYIDSPCINVDCNGNTCAAAPFATCYDIIGGTYGCTCAAGLRDVSGDGRTCIPINECAANGTAICTPSAAGGVCTDALFGYSCSCRIGFTGNGTGINGCIDIPECTLGTHKCIGPGAACLELPGSYNCTCSNGWIGSSLDPSECRDINECVVNPQICSSVAHTSCSNRNGSYSCDCITGYRQGITGVCTDINECSELQQACGTGNGVCNNLDGGYACKCPNGYAGNQTDIIPNRHSIICTDINECLAMPCKGSGSNCTNLVGSYQCGCIAGYIGNGTISSPCHLPCDDLPCQVHATCTNDATIAPKYYSCQCNAGYINSSASGACVDDRCAWAAQQNVNLCYGTNAICQSKPTTNYTCSCGVGTISGSGYSGAPCVPAVWPPRIDAAVTTFIVPVQNNGQLAPYVEVRVVNSMGMGAMVSSVSAPGVSGITSYGISTFPSGCTSSEYCSQTATLQMAVNGCQLNNTAVTFDWLSYCATISCPWQNHHYQTFLFSSSNGCPTTIDSSSVIAALTSTLYYRKNATRSNYAPVFPQPVFTLDDIISLVIKVVSIAPISALGLVQLTSRSSSTSVIYLVTDSTIQVTGITVTPVATNNIIIVNIPARVLFQNGLAAQTSGIFVINAVVALGYRIGETTVQSLQHVESLTHTQVTEQLAVQARNGDNGASIIPMDATTQKYSTAILQIGTGLSSSVTYTVYISYTREPTIGTLAKAFADLLGVSTSRFSDLKIQDGQLVFTIGTPATGSGEASTPELIANLQVYLSRRLETKSVAALATLNDMTKLESVCLAASGSCETLVTPTGEVTPSDTISTLAIILIACAGLLLLVSSVIFAIGHRRYKWCQSAPQSAPPGGVIDQPLDRGEDPYEEAQLNPDGIEMAAANAAAAGPVANAAGTPNGIEMVAANAATAGEPRAGAGSFIDLSVEVA